jgi:hypothetical protein
VAAGLPAGNSHRSSTKLRIYELITHATSIASAPAGLNSKMYVCRLLYPLPPAHPDYLVPSPGARRA